MTKVKVAENIKDTIQDQIEKLKEVREHLSVRLKQTEDRLSTILSDMNLLENYFSLFSEVSSQLKSFIEKFDTLLHGFYSNFESLNKEEVKSYYIKLIDISTQLTMFKEKVQSLEELFEKAKDIMEKAKNFKKVLNEFFELNITQSQEFAEKFNEIMENLDIVNSVQRMNERIIKAQEEERKRLSREVHDGPAQAVANIAMQLDFCYKLIEEDPEKVRETIKELSELSKRILRNIRAYIFDLRPMTLDDLGLYPTLMRYFENFRKSTGKEINFKFLGDTEKRFNKNIETSVFRVVQEAVNNARKHAAQADIEVCITLKEDRLEGYVSDNGPGFDVEATLTKYYEKEKLGLMSMKERIELVNGKFEIKSQIGAGTKIAFIIPL